jgi:HD-GYP domain-containing protein (c-di-GMP phosphodiesterase class II)
LTWYLPQVMLATLIVAVMPVAAVWGLRARGVLSSMWVCLALAVALALGASSLGNVYWKRRLHSVDVTFSELMFWGWLRRIRIERQLTNLTELLGLGDAGGGSARGVPSAERSGQLLRKLADALERQDAYTSGHSRRIARRAADVAHRMKLPSEQIATIQAAAAVHDVGKLMVPRELLNKPGRLTDAEYEIVKRHADQGAAMVACLGDSELTAIVRYHHERLDGSGYPAGLTADQIPVGALIVAVVDTYDAITATRPYRAAAPQKRAIEVLRAEAGVRLDADAVQAFLKSYSGKRALALWTVLMVVPQRAFGWRRSPGRIQRPSSPGQQSATAAAFALLAVIAIAAPISLTRHRRRTPATPVSASAPAITPPRATPRAQAPPRPHKVVHVSVNSTCQAYNPQLCSTLGVNATSGGAPSQVVGGLPSQVVGGSSGVGSTMPFTG